MAVSVSQNLKIARNIRARESVISAIHPSRVKILQPFGSVVIMPFLKRVSDLVVKLDLIKLDCEAGREVSFDCGKDGLSPFFVVGLEERGIAAHIFGISFDFAIHELYRIAVGFRSVS